MTVAVLGNIYGMAPTRHSRFNEPDWAVADKGQQRPAIQSERYPQEAQ